MRSWVVTGIVTEALCVAITLGYYGCVKQAYALPLMAHLTLALQMTATACFGMLTFWIATAATADKGTPCRFPPPPLSLGGFPCRAQLRACC